MLVRDEGKPEVRESAGPVEVNVTVIRNTYAPYFVDDVSASSLSETAEVGAQVAVIEAKDDDEEVSQTSRIT